MADVNGPPKNNYEAFPPPSEEELLRKKRRRNRCLLGLAAFVIIHVAMIPVLVLVIMKVKSPTLRLRSVTLVGDPKRDGGSGSSTNTSFSLTLNAALVVKNPNFGRYKYQNGSVSFSYEGGPVWDGSIPAGKVGFKSRRTVEGIVVKLRLRSDLRSANFTLNVRGKLDGKVTTMMMWKKKKSSKEMNCSLPINMLRKVTGEIIC